MVAVRWLGASALVCASLVTASPAQAANTNVEQSLADTLCADVITRFGTGPNPDCVASINGVITDYGKTKAKIEAAMNSLSASCGTAHGPLNTWGRLVRCMIGDGLAWPFQLGASGLNGGGGAFGGAGGQADTWNDTHKVDCGKMSLKVAADNSIIIPSAPLRPGGAIEVGTPGQQIFVSGSAPNGSQQNHADSLTAIAKRMIHLHNMNVPDKRQWYGVLGVEGLVIKTASVAFHDGVSIQPRTTATFGGYTANAGAGTHDGFTHQSCPASGSGGGFDFYGYNTATAGFPTGFVGGHMHNCIWFVPDTSLSASGYAINDETSIPWSDDWPGTGYPQVLKDCKIDPGLIKKMLDRMYKKANDTPGFDGIPYAPVQAASVRPGNTTVGDLNQPRAILPVANPAAPPPTNPALPTPPPGQVNLGPEPVVASPTIADPPTGIMDPVFEWLPDLPSITFDTNNSECPVWAINLTSFGGPEWQWLLEEHCPLLESNRAAIGTLMIALFGLGAAMVILRA